MRCLALNFQTRIDFLSPFCMPSSWFVSLNLSILSVLSLSEGSHITVGKREEDWRLNAKHWIKHDYHVQAGPASEVSDYHECVHVCVCMCATGANDRRPTDTHLDTSKHTLATFHIHARNTKRFQSYSDKTIDLFLISCLSWISW